ncbi:MAG: DUF1049 domain-containing protein [Deltaproteobacteria bacterium]|nr:DUF1049 domain-containing protein [Deltaproteobacteria bacterium]
MAKPKFIIITIAVATLAVLLVQNAEVVSLKLFFWEISMSRIIFFPILILAGFIIGFAVAKMTGSKNKSDTD